MEYRREIDGLRTIAVLPVILFHAGFQVFSGGFVGVDIFFVISGYLITTIILSELEDGNFSITNFYERRARRILPALFFVLLACLPLAWLTLFPDDMKSFSRSLMAVSVFASNIFFWQSSGYFDAAAELKPLLHTWSLAVEEQYYLLFPIFLVLTWRLGRRWILGLLAAAFVLSLGAAQWTSMTKPIAAFFLLPTRGWELLVGAFVAFYVSNVPRTPTYKVAREFGGCTGLALIFYAIATFDKQTPFPGFYALVPTVGAALIILCATGDTCIARLLGNDIFVRVGLVSYSAYLWHQPLFAFARHRSLEEPSKLFFLGLVSITFALAYLSWRFIEAPFRSQKTFSRRKILTYSILGTFLFLLIGALGDITQGFTELRTTDDRRAFIANLEERKFYKCFSDVSIKNRFNVEASDFCHIGDLNKKPSFVIYGDSHAISLAAGFDIAAKMRNTSGLLIATSSCPPLQGVVPIRYDHARELCLSMNKVVSELVIERGIKKVFLAARWNVYTTGATDGSRWLLGTKLAGVHTQSSSIQAFLSGVENTYRTYVDAGVKPFFIRQVPNQRFDPKRVYGLFGTKSDAELLKLSVSLSQDQLYQKIPNDIFKASLPYDNIIDTSSTLCQGGVCLIGNTAQSSYLDADHLNDSGAAKLAKLFASYL